MAKTFAVGSEKLASFLVCIGGGLKAKDCASVKTDEDRAAYAQLEKEYADIKGKGYEVEIPSDGWI